MVLPLSAVSQNQPLKVEIKGFKTSHFLEQKTAPQNHPDAGPMGHVERPQSESASNDLQFTRQRLVPPADRQTRSGWIDRSFRTKRFRPMPLPAVEMAGFASPVPSTPAGGRNEPDHAAYMASWLRLLEDDPRAIFTKYVAHLTRLRPWP